MSLDVKQAMVLAAGQGVRMRPLTLSRPKPLVEVKGKALIDFAFDRLREAGVTHAVVNVHHLARQIEEWASRQLSPRITISDERNSLLDTGGGIAHALPHLGDDPFYVLNSDSFWTDGAVPALRRLRVAWDGLRMDCILLLCPLHQTIGYGGKGDFFCETDGRLLRHGNDAAAPFVYAGCYLVHPRLFQNHREGRFSMNVLWDKAIAEDRLYGLVHDGRWLHVGTPESIALAESALDGR